MKKFVLPLLIAILILTACSVTVNNTTVELKPQTASEPVTIDSANRAAGESEITWCEPAARPFDACFNCEPKGPGEWKPVMPGVDFKLSGMTVSSVDGTLRIVDGFGNTRFLDFYEDPGYISFGSESCVQQGVFTSLSGDIVYIRLTADNSDSVYIVFDKAASGMPWRFFEAHQVPPKWSLTMSVTWSTVTPDLPGAWKPVVSYEKVETPFGVPAYTDCSGKGLYFGFHYRLLNRGDTVSYEQLFVIDKKDVWKTVSSFPANDEIIAVTWGTSTVYVQLFNGTWNIWQS